MASRYLNARTRNILLATSSALAMGTGWFACAAPVLGAWGMGGTVLGGLALGVVSAFRIRRDSNSFIKQAQPSKPGWVDLVFRLHASALLAEACHKVGVRSRLRLGILNDSMPVRWPAACYGDKVFLSRSFFADGMEQGPEIFNDQEVSAVLTHEVGHSLHPQLSSIVYMLENNVLAAGAIIGAISGSASLAFAGAAGWAAARYLSAFTARQIEFLCDRESLCGHNDPMPMSRVLTKLDLYDDILQDYRGRKPKASGLAGIFNAVRRFDRRLCGSHPTDQQRIAELFTVSGRGSAPASILSPEEKRDFTRFIEAGLRRDAEVKSAVLK